jgi:hypothetical protein
LWITIISRVSGRAGAVVIAVLMSCSFDATDSVRGASPDPLAGHLWTTNGSVRLIVPAPTWLPDDADAVGRS